MNSLKVLVGCESSGIVRDAFARLGCDAWSCDLAPTEQPGNHYQGDVRDLLCDHWDIAILHPPCTYLANSGNRWLSDPRYPERHQQREEAISFFLKMLNAPIERICVENPIPNGYVIEHVGKYAQTVQPWYFGDGFSKCTCLWLKNLSLLRPTRYVAGREQECWLEPPGEQRQINRSRTYPGIAEAMAAQWSIPYPVNSPLFAEAHS